MVLCEPIHVFLVCFWKEDRMTWTHGQLWPKQNARSSCAKAFMLNIWRKVGSPNSNPLRVNTSKIAVVSTVLGNIWPKEQILKAEATSMGGLTWNLNQDKIARTGTPGLQKKVKSHVARTWQDNDNPKWQRNDTDMTKRTTKEHDKSQWQNMTKECSVAERADK